MTSKPRLGPVLLVLRLLLVAVALTAAGLALQTKEPGSFRFAILGDRTGEAVPGVFAEAWRETDKDHPDFVINVGDTIQGGNDLTLDREWRAARRLIAPYRRYRIFSTPGNHDIWSVASAQAYDKYTGRPAHYSFDFRGVHFTVIDNSRTDSLPAEELSFLKRDLEAHQAQKLKFIFFHRPSWLISVVLRNPDFPLHQLARHYGVSYIISGHIHQMLHFELDGVTYISMASSGGHLREPKTYTTGWFFQHTLVTVHGSKADFAIKELAPPFGQSRVTSLDDWGALGLKLGAEAKSSR